MKKRKTILLFILLVSLSLLMCISTFVILSNTNSSRGISLLNNFLYNMPICLIIGLIDYVIIDKLQKYSFHYKNFYIVIDITLTAFFAGVLSIGLNYSVSSFSSMPFYLLESVLPIILWNSIIVLFIEIFFYHKRQIENINKLAVIEKEKALYQFKVLKNQINPHFLFNSLNVLASLAYQDAEKTNLFAKKLSNVYRYLLATHERPTVSLEEELQFVDSYLFLEQIRFGNTLQVIIKNDGQNQNRNIIPASLQMLVENALKHNISTSKSPLIICIKINSIKIIVSNNLQLRNYVSKNGIGLNNLKKQYSLYNKDINIKETKTEFIVEIPFID